MTKVKINGKEYEVSPLKVKHLRRISSILSENKQVLGTFNSIERFVPFMLESIQVRNPNFTEDDLSEASLQELLDAWEVIVKSSGIKFISGEPRPAEKVNSSEQSTESVIQ